MIDTNKCIACGFSPKRPQYLRKISIGSMHPRANVYRIITVCASANACQKRFATKCHYNKFMFLTATEIDMVEQRRYWMKKNMEQKVVQTIKIRKLRMTRQLSKQTPFSTPGDNVKRKPPQQKPCPVCYTPMTHTNSGWVCPKTHHKHG